MTQQLLQALVLQASVFQDLVLQALIFQDLVLQALVLCVVLGCFFSVVQLLSALLDLDQHL